MRMQKCLGLVLTAGLGLLALGCGGDSAERERRIREEAAKAAEKARPAVQEAGRDLRAAAEGAKEGWERNGHHVVNLNGASEESLTGLPGIDKRAARKIIDGRPYDDKRDLVRKRILSQSEYDRIKDDVDVR